MIQPWRLHLYRQLAKKNLTRVQSTSQARYCMLPRTHWMQSRSCKSSEPQLSITCEMPFCPSQRTRSLQFTWAWPGAKTRASFSTLPIQRRHRQIWAMRSLMLARPVPLIGSSVVCSRKSIKVIVWYTWHAFSLTALLTMASQAAAANIQLQLRGTGSMHRAWLKYWRDLYFSPIFTCHRKYEALSFAKLIHVPLWKFEEQIPSSWIRSSNRPSNWKATSLHWVR